jgi:hypothetical protein
VRPEFPRCRCGNIRWLVEKDAFISFHTFSVLKLRYASSGACFRTSIQFLYLLATFRGNSYYLLCTDQSGNHANGNRLYLLRYPHEWHTHTHTVGEVPCFIHIRPWIYLITNVIWKVNTILLNTECHRWVFGTSYSKTSRAEFEPGGWLLDYGFRKSDQAVLKLAQQPPLGQDLLNHEVSR